MDEILGLIAYGQTPLNAYADVSSRARGINFGLNLQLHLYFVYTSSEGSAKLVHLHRVS